MIKEMQHQILLAHITEYGFFLIQTIQCHGTRFSIGVTKFLTGIRQMSQNPPSSSVCLPETKSSRLMPNAPTRKLQIIRRHLAVIDKTAYSTYFTLFTFLRNCSTITSNWLHHPRKYRRHEISCNNCNPNHSPETYG